MKGLQPIKKIHDLKKDLSLNSYCLPLYESDSVFNFRHIWKHTSHLYSQYLLKLFNLKSHIVTVLVCEAFMNLKSYYCRVCVWQQTTAVIWGWGDVFSRNARQASKRLQEVQWASVIILFGSRHFMLNKPQGKHHLPLQALTIEGGGSSEIRHSHVHTQSTSMTTLLFSSRSSEKPGLESISETLLKNVVCVVGCVQVSVSDIGRQTKLASPQWIFTAGLRAPEFSLFHFL